MNKQTEIQLVIINPGSALVSDRSKRFEDLGVTDVHALLPNVGIAYLLAVAEKHEITAKYFDLSAKQMYVEDLVNQIVACNPQVVAFTGWTSLIKNSAAIAKLVKDRLPNVLTCTGGPHGTAVPKETLDEFDSFDFVVPGEAENVIVDLFRSNLNYDSIPAVVSRTKTEQYVRDEPNIESLPWPKWDVFDWNLYVGFSGGLGKQQGVSLEIPISASRGCPFTCTFCWRQFGRHRRNRSAENVLGEIERNIKDFNCSSVNFFDELFVDNNDIEWNVDIMEGLIRKGFHKKIKWAAETRVDVKDVEIFKLMKRSGCYFMFFGVESANPNIRKNVGKIFTNDQVYESISKAHNEGINCQAAFILGLPQETEGTMMESINMAKGLNIYSTTFPIAVPFPGTAIRKSAEKRQWGLKILTNDWSVYDKQYPGVMDSDTLSIDTIRNYQKLAYQTIPQKKMRF